MARENTENKILKILLKQFLTNWTITLLANEIKLSRVGVWKVLKKLEKEKLINLIQLGRGKTNTTVIKLNWNNPILEKKLSLILTEEASNYQRWLNNFNELDNLSEFVILFGSILHSPKEANNIDILGVISNKKTFLKIEKIIQIMQKTQFKKIHSESFIKSEFKEELRKPNKVFIDAIKRGVVLFGQEKFIKFMKDIQK